MSETIVVVDTNIIMVAIADKDRAYLPPDSTTRIQVRRLYCGSRPMDNAAYP